MMRESSQTSSKRSLTSFCLKTNAGRIFFIYFLFSDDPRQNDEAGCSLEAVLLITAGTWSPDS
jgi:hypothetical protein